MFVFSCKTPKHFNGHYFLVVLAKIRPIKKVMVRVLKATEVGDNNNTQTSFPQHAIVMSQDFSGIFEMFDKTETANYVIWGFGCEFTKVTMIQSCINYSNSLKVSHIKIGFRAKIYSFGVERNSATNKSRYEPG